MSPHLKLSIMVISHPYLYNTVGKTGKNRRLKAYLYTQMTQRKHQEWHPPLNNTGIRQVSDSFGNTFETRNRSLFMFGVSTGGRISELICLQIT